MAKQKVNFSFTIPAILGLLVGFLLAGIVGAILGLVIVVYVMKK